MYDADKRPKTEPPDELRTGLLVYQPNRFLPKVCPPIAAIVEDLQAAGSKLKAADVESVLDATISAVRRLRHESAVRTAESVASMVARRAAQREPSPVRYVAGLLSTQTTAPPLGVQRKAIEAYCETAGIEIVSWLEGDEDQADPRAEAAMVFSLSLARPCGLKVFGLDQLPAPRPGEAMRPDAALKVAQPAA